MGTQDATSRPWLNIALIRSTPAGRFFFLAFALHLRRAVRKSGRIDRTKTVEQDRGRSGMFTAMACATVALVVLIERRRQGFNDNPVGEISTSREGSRFDSYLPFAILIALGVVVDRIPW
jgi:hypothetical protein